MNPFHPNRLLELFMCAVAALIAVALAIKAGLWLLARLGCQCAATLIDRLSQSEIVQVALDFAALCLITAGCLAWPWLIALALSDS